MHGYSHGGNAVYEDGKENIIDLSASINPMGMPDDVIGAIAREIAKCSRYPDSSSRKLREKIAEFEGVDPDWIFCGNGASDVIFRLPKAVRAKKTAVTAPTFSDYERSAISFGSEIVRQPLSSIGGFAINGTYAELISTEKPDLAFICNPNNPTGRLTEPGIIAQLLEFGRKVDTVVAVDECFLDFTENADTYTSKCFLKEFQNLVILKAYTKTFALPGIRLGYAICADTAMNNRLYSSGPDWPVSNLAQAAGLAALESAESFIKETVSLVASGRASMERELARIGYNVFPASANYVFLHNPFKFHLHKELERIGIRVRPCGNFHGLDDSYCRIAVSSDETNKKLLTAVEDITAAMAGKTCFKQIGKP